LVAKDGTTVKRYGSMDTPASVSKDIAASLAI
jgi:glutathione peroxidase-family protein